MNEKEKKFWQDIKKEGLLLIENYENMIMFQKAVLETVEKKLK